MRKEKPRCQLQQDCKRRKLMSDLGEREQVAFAVDPSTSAQLEKDRIARKLKYEIARIRSMCTSKSSSAVPTPHKEITTLKDGEDWSRRQ